MAKTANAENVKAAVVGPDYDAAIKLIRGEIAGDKKRTSSIGQAIGKAWKRIEQQFGMNRAAAQAFARVDEMAVETRTDYLRTFFNLCNRAGYGTFDDLVDRAEKASPERKPRAARSTETAAKPRRSADDAKPGPEGDTDLVDAGDASRRINLKTGWVQKHIGAGAGPEDVNWIDEREATAEEMAAERERVADFAPPVAGKPNLTVVGAPDALEPGQKPN